MSTLVSSSTAGAAILAACSKRLVPLVGGRGWARGGDRSPAGSRASRHIFFSGSVDGWPLATILQPVPLGGRLSPVSASGR